MTDIKKLSRFITSDEFVNETEIVYNTLERDDLFNDGVNHNSIANMSVDEARAYSIKRLKRLYEYAFNLNFFNLHYAMTAVQVDNDTRRGINFGVCWISIFLHAFLFFLISKMKKTLFFVLLKLPLS